MVLVVHLEHVAKLLVEHGFELLLILGGNETIVEDTQDLVAPKFDQVLLGVLICLLSHVQALEHLRDITHVEHVVSVGGRWQELLLHSVVHIDGTKGQVLAQSLDLLGEVEELECGQ